MPARRGRPRRIPPARRPVLIAVATAVLVAVPAVDSAALTDTAALSVTASVTDSVALSESSSIVVTLTATDTAAVADTSAVAVVLSGVDSGALAETSAQVVVLTASDSGALDDVSGLDTGSTDKAGTDAGTLAESAERAETGYTTQTPSTADAADGPYSLGTETVLAVDGNIVGVRWYGPGTAPGATITAALFDAVGTSQATTSFTAISTGAWNEARFASPVPAAAGSHWRPTIWTPDRYVATSGQFNNVTIVNGDQTLTGGYFAVGGSAPVYPTSQFGDGGYFVDLIFVPNIPTGVAGTDTGTLADSSALTITQVVAGTDTVTLTDASALAAAVSTSDSATAVESAADVTSSESTADATLSESSLIGLPVTDGGALAESASVFAGTNISASDTAALGEAAGIVVVLTGQDTVVLAEAGTVGAGTGHLTAQTRAAAVLVGATRRTGGPG